mgnify:CR=1 FL=1
MRTNGRIVAIGAALIAGSWWCGAAAAQHAGDVWVGRTAAGQLAIGGYPVDDEIVVLPPVEGLLKGWANNDPGFDHVNADDPAGDLYRLGSGAQIWLEVVAVEPALRIIDAAFQILDAPGERTYLGDVNMHTHLTWHINRLDPQFDPQQWVWSATLVLRDFGSTGYADSEPFTMYFANRSCLPGDVNGDGSVDTADIDAFVATIVDPDGATAAERCAADANGDGVVDTADIDAFVALIVGG